MSLRRGEYARLEAASWTVTLTSPWQRRLAALVVRQWSR